MTATNNHASFSPSDAARWTTCPGSHKLRDELVTQGKITGEQAPSHAIRNSLLRELMSVAIKERRPPTQTETLTAIKNWPGANVAPEQWQAMADEISGAYTALISELDLNSYTNLRLEHRVEITQPFSSHGIIDLCADRSDRGYKTGGLIAIWKFDAATVSVEHSLQLALYAYMAHGTSYPVEVVVVQKQTAAKAEYHAKLRNFRSSALEQHMKKMKAAVREMQDPAPRFVPHPSICCFCPVASHCPVQHMIHNLLKLTSKPTTDEAGEDAYETDLVRMYRLGNLAEKFQKVIKTHVTAVGDTPGFKIVQGKASNRKWEVPDEIVKSVLETNGVFDPMLHMKFLSPPQLEKRDQASYALVEQHVAKRKYSSQVICLHSALSK